MLGGLDKCSGCESCQNRLDGLSIFSKLSPESVKALDKSRRTQTFPVGHLLFQEGEPSSGLWCLSKGIVKVFHQNLDGRQHFLRWARPGEPIGYRALFLGQPHATTAETLTECQICHLPGRIFKELFEKEPNLRDALVRKLGADLKGAELGWIREAGFSSQQRVANMLLDWDDIPHQQLSRKDIAEAAGVTPATLSRVLTQFHQKEIIKRSPRRLKILDRGALEAMAEGR